MRLNKTIKIIILLLVLFLPGFYIFAESSQSLIPKEFQYKGLTYNYDPYWKEDELYIEANIDSDSDNEVIVAFGAIEKSSPEPKAGYFWQVYDLSKKTYRLRKTSWANEYPSKIFTTDLNSDGIDEIFVYSNSGIYRNNIYIYQWLDGDYAQIFGHTTIYGIFVDTQVQPPLISIEVPNWKGMAKADREFAWQYTAKPLQQIYIWDGRTFSFHELRSTAKGTFDVRRIKRVHLFSRPLLEGSSGSSALKDEKIEHIVINLDNKRFYFVYQKGNKNFDTFKDKVKKGELVRLEFLSENLYKMKLLYDQEEEVTVKYDETLDGVNPVTVFQ